jgi:hypothetical protein
MFYSLNQKTFNKTGYQVLDLPKVINIFYKLNFKKRIWFYDQDLNLITFIN